MLINTIEDAISSQCKSVGKNSVQERKLDLKIKKLKTGNPIIDHFKTHYWIGAEFVGKYELLKLEPTVIKDLPKEDEVISFSEVFSSKYRNNLSNYWIDMFNDDYIIERFWKCPEKYLPIMKKAKGVIAGDYSVMKGLLLTDNVYNVQRNRITAFMIGRETITTIPVASWDGEESFDWCFDGLPHHSVIAITSNGCLKSGCVFSKDIFIKGVFELNKRKNPMAILICGPHLEELDVLENVHYYHNYSQRLKKRLKNNG